MFSVSLMRSFGGGRAGRSDPPLATLTDPDRCERRPAVRQLDLSVATVCRRPARRAEVRLCPGSSPRLAPLLFALHVVLDPPDPAGMCPSAEHSTARSAVV